MATDMQRVANTLLWFIYLCLLAVLLPHTAWAFAQHEPETARTFLGQPLIAWAAALTFEGAIAALTYKAARHIEAVPRYKDPWRRWRSRYLNVYFAGLLLAVAVSTLANWSHAVEFARTVKVAQQHEALTGILPIVFGGVLPIVSLTFAHILADIGDAEEVVNEKLAEAQARRREAEAEVRRLSEQLQRLSARLGEAEDLILRIFAEDKKQRILAIKERWPALPNTAVAIIAESSPSYVSEVLNGKRGKAGQAR